MHYGFEFATQCADFLHFFFCNAFSGDNLVNLQQNCRPPLADSIRRAGGQGECLLLNGERTSQAESTLNHRLRSMQRRRDDSWGSYPACKSLCGRVMLMKGDLPSPGGGRGSMTKRTVISVESNNEHRLEVFSRSPATPSTKVMEAVLSLIHI